MIGKYIGDINVLDIKPDHKPIIDSGGIIVDIVTKEHYPDNAKFFKLMGEYMIQCGEDEDYQAVAYLHQRLGVYQPYKRKENRILW